MIVLCMMCGRDVSRKLCPCRRTTEHHKAVSHLQRVVQLAAALASDGTPTERHLLQAAESLRGEPS